MVGTLNQKLSDWGRSVTSAEPRPALASLKDEGDIARYVRLWLMEGIPFAFRGQPVLYDVLREWVAEQLDIATLDVSIVGSARLGFSLNPSQWDLDFRSGRSDLDGFVVSERLFSDLQHDFEQWVEDWENGYLHEQEKREGRYWEDNRNLCLSNQKWGFLDESKIPAYDGYRTVRRCRRTAETLAIMVMTPSGERLFKSASFRVFKSWSAAEQRSVLNLQHVLKKIGPSSS